MARAFTRRTFTNAVAAGACALGQAGGGTARAGAAEPAGRQNPNIIFILADDLGWGELGCYGQAKIRTPSIDKLAAEGMRFTQCYSGSPVCAPSRCTLLTGLHTGHAYIRDNDELPERGDVWGDPAFEGQRPILPGTFTLGVMLKAQGYATAAIGKWGLGGPGSTGEPLAQGFDRFNGYLCQRAAHNYYPTYLWRDRAKDVLANPAFAAHQRLPAGKDPNDPASYAGYRGTQWAPDLMAEEALRFIRAHRDRPFFLYLAFPVPHVALQVPEDSLREYEGAFPETPYTGTAGYLPHRTPRACYAAMVTRMDRHVGRVMALLEELGIERRTAVFASSDNGPTFNGGTDSAFFGSAGPFRGLKASLYEGGIRVPMIVRWPGRVAPGAVTNHVAAFWDVMPTLAGMAGAPAPPGIDGVSFLPQLLGGESSAAPRALYWEYHATPSQAVRLGRWKGVRFNKKRSTDAPIELYDIEADIGEKTDLASRRPDVVTEIEKAMATRTVSPVKAWNWV